MQKITWKMSQTQKSVATEPVLDMEAILSREMSGARGLSWYQLRVVAIGAIAAVFSGITTNEYVFTTGRITTRCLIPECENSTMISHDFAPDWLSNVVPSTDAGFDNCQRFASAPGSALGGTPATCPATLFDQNTTVGCEQYVYSNTNTAVFTLGLACDEWRRSLLGSARTLGALVSLPVAGAISDRWGRRIALLIVCFNTAWIGALRVFATTYIGFVTSVFAEAAFGAGAILAIAYVLGIEQVAVKDRIKTGAIMHYFNTIGQVVLSTLAWALPDWRHLTLALYLPQLLMIPFFWFTPESVRWSLSKGRYSEAEIILRKIANSRGKSISEKSLMDLKTAAEHEKAKSFEKATRKEPWLVVLVFRHKPILLRALILPVCWITVILIYYGLAINAVHISGNKYFNYIIVSLVDLPAYFTVRLLLDRLGRKPVIVTGYLVCATCQMAYIFLPADSYGLSLTVYLVGKFGITTVGASIYVYTTELYPTQYRHRLFGYTSMTGRIGSIIAPLTPALGAIVWESLPFALFGGMALLSGLLILLLIPETCGHPLPDTMEEAANIRKHNIQKPTAQYDNHALS